MSVLDILSEPDLPSGVHQMEVVVGHPKDLGLLLVQTTFTVPVKMGMAVLSTAEPTNCNALYYNIVYDLYFKRNDK